VWHPMSLPPHIRALLIPLFVFAAACTPADNQERGDVSVTTPILPMSGPADERWYSESPEGNLIVYGQSEGDQGILMAMEKRGSEWGSAIPLPFSGAWDDRAPRYYPALNVLLFSSNRPLPGETKAGDFNLWVVAHDGEAWMDPEPFMISVTEADESNGAVSGSGTVYFASNRDGGEGQQDIYRARLGSMGYEVEAIGAPVSTSLPETDVWVDPGERYLIISRTDETNGLGGSDLWIVFSEGTGWSAPILLGPEVNSAGDEYGAWVSRDGATLYFTTHRAGQADIARIALADLPIEGPEGWISTSIE